LIKDIFNGIQWHNWDILLGGGGGEYLMNLKLYLQ